MDCRIPREQFIGTETFTGPDGLTYPKVNVTSNWNQLCLVAWNTNIDYDDENFNGVSYEFTETIDEGEYTYEELYNSILDIFQMFKEQHANFNIGDVSSSNLNIDTSIKILIDCDGLKNDINYNYINNNAEIIDFNNSIFIGASGNYIILIKQVENGIDKILPFTIPFQTFTSELLSDPISTQMKYNSFVHISYDNDYIDEFYRAFIHPAFFNMIWLNENFFTTDNKKIISTDQLGYMIYNYDNFITDAGIFSKYGLLMNMMGLLFYNNAEYISSIPSFYKNDTNSVIQLLAENTDYNNPLYIENKIQFESLYNLYEINTNNVEYYSDHYANLYDFSSPFEYEANEFNIPIGRLFTTTPVNELQGQTSYSISGNLPSGLTLNTSTGVISGTPTTISTRQITITANNDGIYTFDLIIKTVAEQYVYNSPVNNITPNSQFTITPVNPPTSLFGGELTFNNVLVNGMTFNGSTGVITGNSSNLNKPVIITINMTESLANTTMTYSQQIFVKSPKYYINLQYNMMIYE